MTRCIDKTSTRCCGAGPPWRGARTRPRSAPPPRGWRPTRKPASWHNFSRRSSQRRRERGPRCPCRLRLRGRKGGVGDCGGRVGRAPSPGRLERPWTSRTRGRGDGGEPTGRGIPSSRPVEVDALPGEPQIGEEGAGLGTQCQPSRVSTGSSSRCILEHGVPHFHAIYAEHNGVFAVETLEMIEGDLPARARGLVVEWATRYQRELLEMWKTQEYRQLPGLE